MYSNKNKLFLVISLVLIVLCLKPANLVHAEEQNNQNDSPILQFPVLSDVHIGGELQQDRFKKALTQMGVIAPNYNAIVLLGDNTDMGKINEYDKMMRIFNDFSKADAEKIIAIGNHDYWEGLFSAPIFIPEFYQDRFIKKTRMPGLYYSKVVNGYHFITLGSEGFPDDDNYDHVLMSDKQYSWLEETLAQAMEPDKPIFVFMHQPIDHTVYGSEEWGAGFTDTRLSDILKQYPQVILFSGHTHYLLNHPRTIYQNGFTNINAGSVAYGSTDIGNIGTSQGLLVNVYSDRVEIKAREFTNNTEIQTFTVKIPYEQTYGIYKKPEFPKGSKAVVNKNVSGDSVAISFDSAVGGTLVDRYLIKQMQNGKVIHTHYVDFWSKPLSGPITIELTGLTPETQYDWQIYAVDAWNNESSVSLPISFKTSKLNGWKLNNQHWVYYVEGSKAVGWKFISGAWYLFHPDGVMHTGWYSDEQHKYFLNDNGAMQIGWKTISGKTYYFGPSGDLKTGWVMDKNKWYYLDHDGSPKLGWIFDEGKWYYLISDGMATGWQLDGTTWYFLNNSGQMQTGWHYWGGIWYYLSGSGAMKSGWTSIGNKWYYLSSNGAMKTGWLLENGTWYYLKGDGSMQTGWLLENGIWYYLKANGAMQTDWANINGIWYYFASNGSLI